MGEGTMEDSSSDRPFAELPAALVDEMLQSTEGLSERLLGDFERVRASRQQWRDQLVASRCLRRDSDLPYVPIPTTCAVDGSYAVERLLATDLVAAAAVAVEGLTPPSETRYWPEPRHQVVVETESHEPDTGTILRALMIGMELELAANAPHDLVLLDGSMSTPLIYLNQALNKVAGTRSLRVAEALLSRAGSFLASYYTILSSSRTDRAWVAVPKYTTLREMGQRFDWPQTYDDRGLLSHILEPGEFTQPQQLQQPAEPWHLNVRPLLDVSAQDAHRLGEQVIALLASVEVLYYRPYPWLPALRLEVGRSVADTPARLAAVLHGIRHQCGTPAAMEPYPLYMADRMVKHLSRAIPAFRQVASQRIAESYQGDMTDIFLGLHGYRSESGA